MNKQEILKLRREETVLRAQWQELTKKLDAITRDCKHDFVQVLPGLHECKNCFVTSAPKGW